MTAEEAIKYGKEQLEIFWSKNLEFVKVANRSLEAWDKVIKDATERTITFIPKSLEGNETYDSAFHDGVNYVVDIIKGHLGEVEE